MTQISGGEPETIRFPRLGEVGEVETASQSLTHQQKGVRTSVTAHFIIIIAK